MKPIWTIILIIFKNLDNVRDEAYDFCTYNGNIVHDIYIDYDYQINTEEDIDATVDSLNEWD